MGGRKKATARKMTAREKTERARIRQELRSEGLLPPKKKPLNHKKFCEEAEVELRTLSTTDFVMMHFLCWGLLEMLEHGGCDKEAVGAAKVVKLAKRRYDFEKARIAEGSAGTYGVGELYEAVKDIYNA